MTTIQIIHRIYAGWLGKLVGVRLGAPVEMWTHEQIMEKYGEKHGYLKDYREFAADDDVNGPVFFIRALADSGKYQALDSRDVGRAWVNYAPRNAGMYWWGGYGVSSEHTAYENMRAGILPPASGSMDMNGHVIAQQIGGQIFIDAWGLVCPGNPMEAARLAGIAARVAHDGEAVYGGQYVAAAIAAAFDAHSVQEVMERALAQIPGASMYATCVRDVMQFYRDHPLDLWACFAMIRRDYWRDRFPGNCHIIPNAAIMALAMCYGEGDFDKTLEICNRCGFDTDCNVGNVGTIMGVLLGLGGVDQKWLAPINDRFVCSGAIGALNVRSASGFVRELVGYAMKMGNLKLDAPWQAWAQGEGVDFALPGATGGFMCLREGEWRRECDWRDGTLNITPDAKGEACVSFRTYDVPQDFEDDRYHPSFSPLVYPGQMLCAAVEGEGSARVVAFVQSGQHTERLYGHWAKGATATLSIPPMQDALIRRVGVEGRGAVALRRFWWQGAPRYSLTAGALTMENWAFDHQEVSQFSHAQGLWRLEKGSIVCSSTDAAYAFTGAADWADVSVRALIKPQSAKYAGVALRVSGVLRAYQALISAAGEVRLVRLDMRAKTLKMARVAPASNGEYDVRIQAQGAFISVYVNDVLMIEAEDKNPLDKGCVGLCVKGAGHAAFLKIEVEGV